MNVNNPSNQTSNPHSVLRLPKISVIVPTYNKSAYLARLLPSIIAQDFDPHLFEIIIVDDGSTDNTGQIVQQFAEVFANFRYVYQHRQGIGAARNKGLSHARGELISFLADDYVLDPKYLEKMSSAFIDDTISGIRPLFDSLGDTSIELAMHVGMISCLKNFGKHANKKIYKSPSVLSWGGASMTRRSLFHKFGPFIEAFSTGEDTEYSLRLALAGIRIHVFNEVLFKIKNRMSFVEAHCRVFQYGFNGALVKKHMANLEPSIIGFKSKYEKSPFLLRLSRLVGRPILNPLRHMDNFIEAIKIMPYSYTMMAVSVFGILYGKLSSKESAVVESVN